MGTFKPSKYQQAIYDFIVDGTGNTVVNACAGSGKTTTIVNALELIDDNKRVLFLAFNKSIVDELKGRIKKKNVEISTLHSLGLKFIRNYAKYSLGDIDVSIDDNKYRRYIRENLDEIADGVKFSNKMDRSNYLENLYELTNYARFYLCKTSEEVEKISDKHSIIPFDNECEVVLDILNWGSSNVETIDFTDMIYIPNALDIRPTRFRYDFIFIDEIQDLNTAQRELFLKCFKKTTRFIGVGDKKQSIYAFTGVDTESFQKLTEIPNTIELPLSISYRCPMKVINVAKTIVPEIEARDGAIEGTIVDEMRIKDLIDGDMVLSRTTKPLMLLYIKLLKMGKTAYIKGKDIGANMVRLVSNTEETLLNRDMNDKGVFTSLYKELIDRRDKLMVKKNLTEEEATLESGITNLYDNISALEVLSEGLLTTNQLIDRINKMFDNDNEGIILSTIHKSKGLEADNVYILCPSMLPSPLAVKPWEIVQEENLRYVAYTRAKKKLGFIAEKEIGGKKALMDVDNMIKDLRMISSKINYVLTMKNNVLEVKTTDVKITKLKTSKKQPRKKRIKKEEDENELKKVYERKLKRFEKLIKGLTLEEAYDIFNDLGITNTIRAVEKDGEPLIITADFKVDRVNVIVKDNKIVGIKNFG